MQKNLHYVAMGLIFIGSIMLFSLSAYWFTQGNTVMTISMFTMGVVALSNFYLHKRSMSQKMGSV